jgi:hypothetical protein
LAFLPVSVLVAAGSRLAGHGIPFSVLLGAALVVLLCGLLIGRLRVRADSRGVTVRLGILGWPRRHIPLKDIDRADVGNLSLFSAGGLGVRLNPVTGTVAYKVRSRPALAITLLNGRRILVRADHPEPGAGLLNDLVHNLAESPVSTRRSQA